MSPYKKILWISAFLFFSGGLFWGFSQGLLNPSNSTKTLSMICKEEWMPKEVLQEIEDKLHVHIKKIPFADWAEYSRLLANSQGRFDLLCTHSFLAKDLVRSKWLDSYDYRSLPSFRGLSAEFKGLPFDPAQKYFVPVGWLINGFIFKEDSKIPHSWKELWPADGKKLSMNHPDLELYARMKKEGLEMDPEKQGRYNRDPEEMVKKFLKRLGSVHHPGRPLNEKSFETQELFEATNFQVQNLKGKLEALEDGVDLWFLLVGVGSNSVNKELSRKVMNELLTPNSSNQLRIQSGFAHVLTRFNDISEVPARMKANYLREFPLRTLKFPNISLEGLPQWESMVTEALQAKEESKPRF